MPTMLNIADIPIYIKGRDFLKSLTSAEKCLLQQFISRKPSAGKHIKPFIVHIKIVKRPRNTENKPFNPLLIEKVRKCLACPENNNASLKLGLYLRNFFYSDSQQFRKFIDSLMSILEDSKVMPAKDFISIFNRKACISYVFLHERRPGETLSVNYPDVLKALLMMFIIERNGMLLHASSVGDDNSGYIFAGPSGSGKSTIVKIGGFKDILSDDGAAIRKINGSYMIFPNPWWNKSSRRGKLCPKGHRPLKAVFFIKKAKKTGMRRMSLQEGIARLRYVDGFFGQVRFYGDTKDVKKFYTFCLDLLSSVPIFELRIKKGPGFKQEFKSLISYLL